MHTTLFTYNSTYVYMDGERKLSPWPFCGDIPILSIEIRDDIHKYPRPFWHARIQCQRCYANQKWIVVGKQLPDSQPYPIPELEEVDKIINNWNRRNVT